MPVVALPDGQNVRFPDEMPMGEIQALIAHKYPKEVAQIRAKKSAAGGGVTATDKVDPNGQIVPANPMAQGAPTAKPSGDLPGQIMSGVNEGVGTSLSFPNQVARSLESIGPTIVNALGGHAAMPPEGGYLPDAGKAYNDLATDIGAIHAPTADPVEKFGRKAGQYVGGMIVPGIGPVSRAPNALRAMGTAAKELAGGTAAGLGAATGNAMAPDNPLAETAGALIGGGLTVGTSAALRARAAARTAPAVDALRADAATLYRQARTNGVTASQPMTATLATDMRNIATTEGVISPSGRLSTSYPRIAEAIRNFDDYSTGTMNVTQMQATRKVLTDAARSTEPGERRIALRMLQRFDAFTDPLAPELQQANAIYHRAMNGEMIDTAIELAHSRAGQFSGSGFENALRTEFRALERGIIKGDIIGLSDEEIAAITRVAQGGPVENVLRYAGKYAPTGVVSAGAGGALAYGAATALGLPAIPVTAAVMGTGLAARAGATALARGNAEEASALARRGAAPQGVTLSPAEATTLGATTATASNDNRPAALQMANFRNIGNALRAAY